MKRELRMERMNLFSDAGAKSSEALFDLKVDSSEALFRGNVGAKSSEVLFDLKVDSSEALFRGNDKTFDEIPGSKEYLTSILLHKLKE